MAASVGIAAAGAFKTDPVNGYPAGTPAVVEFPTVQGHVHDLVAIPVFLGLPAAAALEAVLSARADRWPSAAC